MYLTDEEIGVALAALGKSVPMFEPQSSQEKALNSVCSKLFGAIVRSVKGEGDA